MARIVFLAPFARHEITGGIKTLHRHAELLTELGFDAAVFQPDGQPSWFETRAKLLTRFAPVSGDILVFPETLNGILVEMLQLPVRKVLFCQAHYYTLFNAIGPERYGALGFERITCQSGIAKGFLERVLRLADVVVLPCFIDTDLFFPRPKLLQIAAIPKKLPREAAAVQRIFNLKYPELGGIGWDIIDNRSERETAESFGRSAIVLSLPFLESFGLVPLEAMASGAIVAGFTGYGAQEYATSENGFWFAPDHLEELADGLARIVTGLQQNDAAILKMREAGFATVARYGKDRAAAALNAFYGPLAGQ
ncbi:MAG TPA: glycosyltransferase [Micropepsaceae bacterium]|nr:glycosyltransferase [Micropepsaceae bacterium]